MTGVQTCALPIWLSGPEAVSKNTASATLAGPLRLIYFRVRGKGDPTMGLHQVLITRAVALAAVLAFLVNERREALKSEQVASPRSWPRA